MTAGDAAAALGFDIVAPTGDVKDGYAEINKSRDYLAEDITSGTRSASQTTSGIFSTDRLPITTILKGGTGATTAEQARTNLGIDAMQTQIDDLIARVTVLEA